MNEQLTHTDLATDLRISRVVTGLWQIADMERDERSVDLDEAAKSMTAYTDAGLATFDMADHYGSAEDIAGIFASGYAGGRDVRMLTKWVPEPGGSSRETVRRAVQRSLDRLRTDCLDLLQYHAWNYADPGYLDDLFHLQALKDEGLIRQLGLTNFDTDHLGIVLASVGFSIGIDPSFLRLAMAALLGAAGVVLLVPALQDRLGSLASPVAGRGQALFDRLQPSGIMGQFALGGVLGVIWSPCSGPTLGAAVGLAAQGDSIGSAAATMAAFALGAATGPPKLRSSFRAVTSAGTRSAMRSRPALSVSFMAHTRKRGALLRRRNRSPPIGTPPS